MCYEQRPIARSQDFGPVVGNSPGCAKLHTELILDAGLVLAHRESEFCTRGFEFECAREYCQLKRISGGLGPNDLTSGTIDQQLSRAFSVRRAPESLKLTVPSRVRCVVGGGPRLNGEQRRANLGRTR